MNNILIYNETEGLLNVLINPLTAGAVHISFYILY